MQKQIEGWQSHEREQLRARLALSYAERLRWLEQAKRFAQQALGAARTDKARIATVVWNVRPDARVAISNDESAWTMDIVVDGRVIVIEQRANGGFRLSECRGDARDHMFATARELEAHLRTL